MDCRKCSWADELLHNISELPKCGVLGKMVVHGERAHAFMACPGGEVVMAAAELGAGRVIVCSHGGYVSGFKVCQSEYPAIHQLHYNMKKWLTRGTYTGKEEVTAVANLSGEIHERTKIIFSRGLPKVGSDLLKKIIEFVRQGGGFVYGVCPKPFLSSASDIPFKPLLDIAGIELLNKKMKLELDHIQISPRNKDICHSAHMDMLVRSCADNQDMMLEYGKTLASMIDLMSDDLLEQKRQNLEIIHSKHADHLKNVFETDKKVTCKHSIVLINIVNSLAKREIGYSKLPGIFHFPGDFVEDPTGHLQSAKTTISQQHNVKELHSTRFYLPAGVQLNLDILGKEPAEAKWFVVVGAHADKLVSKDSLARWPVLRYLKCLKGDHTTISSPVGGLVYFRCNIKSTIHVEIGNFVEAPFYDLENQQSIEEWTDSRRKPGLWCNLEGKFVRFTVPSASIRDFDDPGPILEIWDKLIAGYHDLRGTDVSMCRKQWVVGDVQPGAGYMHSGYPIVTHMDVVRPDSSRFLLDKDSLLKYGRWGAFHELGHNMQKSMWTFKGTGEVTCNIFTLYGMHIIAGTKLEDEKHIQNGFRKAKEYFQSNADFGTWKSKPILALQTYAQLVHYFGWKSFKKVFHAYSRMPMEARPLLDNAKIDQWIITFSHVSKFNLQPFFDFWGWRYTCEVGRTLNELEAMPHFLPDDALTALVPERVDEILERYPNMVRGFPGVCPYGTSFGEQPLLVDEDDTDEDGCRDDQSSIDHELHDEM